MALIIDGYNLLHASGILPRGRGPGTLERSRTALLNFLAESLPKKDLAKTVIVFDAGKPPFGVPRQLVHHQITVYFAVDFASADEMIEELILKHPTPRRLTVVSSDHRLHRAASRRKATAVDSDIWHAQILRQRMQRLHLQTQSEQKPEGPLSDVEVRFWLSHFDATGAATTTPSVEPLEKPAEPAPPPAEFHSPFPPGYGEDLSEE